MLAHSNNLDYVSLKSLPRCDSSWEAQWKHFPLPLYSCQEHACDPSNRAARPQPRAACWDAVADTASDYPSKMFEFSHSGLFFVWCPKLYQVLTPRNTCTSKPGCQQTCRELASKSVRFPNHVSLEPERWLALEQVTYLFSSLGFPSCIEHWRAGRGHPSTAPAERDGGGTAPAPAASAPPCPTSPAWTASAARSAQQRALRVSLLPH